MSSNVCVPIIVLLCIPGSPSLSVLFATEDGVQLFTSSIASETTINNGSASLVDFRYAKKEIFFVDDRHIFYSYFSEYFSARQEPLVTVTAHQNVSALAVDWIHFRVYYCVQLTSAIYETSLLGPSSAQILSLDSEPHGLAVDPYEQLLFFITKGQLQTYDLEKEKLHKEYDLKSESIIEVDRIALNIHRKEVLLVGRGEAGDWRIVRTDYPHSQSHRACAVLAGPLVHDTRALGVFGNQVVWSRDRSLYWCLLAPNCNTSNVTLIHQSSKAILDLKLYNPLVQTESPQSACHLCSHSCSLDSDQVVTCVCPEHSELAPDTITCIDNPLAFWGEWSSSVLSRLKNSTKQLFDSLTAPLTLFILVISIMMLSLLLCGIIVLMLCPPHKRATKQESTVLTERTIRFRTIRTMEDN